MPFQQPAPGRVAEPSSPLRRPDDIREQQRRQHRVRHVRWPLARHEALDLVRDLRRQEDPPIVLSGGGQQAGVAEQIRDGARRLLHPRGAS
jgi:hypothetical protein